MSFSESNLKDDANFLLSADYHDDIDMLDLSFDDLNDTEDLSFGDGNENDPVFPVMNGQMNPKDYDCVDHAMGVTTELENYILGTLIVRVVAARDLKAPRKGHLLNSKARRRIFQRASSSTYANISFGNQSQRTSSVDETINPSWTRTEQSLFFDITLPVPHLVQQNESSGYLGNNTMANERKGHIEEENIQCPPPPKQILAVSLFHSDHGGSTSSNNGKDKHSLNKPKNMSSDHDDLAGKTSIDITSVITGKSTYIDTWLQLEGLDDTVGNGSVRVIVEYECAESPHRVSDKVRFTGFVSPTTLCPLPISQMYNVEEVIGDEIILSYITPAEHWKCTFQAHRYMLISVERHSNAVERYQDELMELANKISHSPAADVVSATMKSLPEEGLLFVGMQAAFGGITLLERWTSKGPKAMLDDIVYATNLDGQHTPVEIEDEFGLGDGDDLSIMTDNIEDSSNHDDPSMCSDTDADYSVASGMPSCPISGEPMRFPVVAADGHTYDKASIRRWLKSSNISPLTGTALKNKDLIPNYLLISSFQKGRKSEESSQVSQF